MTLLAPLAADALERRLSVIGANYGDLFDQSVLNTIYAQTAAGAADPVNFSLRAPNYLYDTATTVTIEPVTNYFDSGHLLLRTANSITANQDRNVIDAYLVSKIAGDPNQETYGYGLISSNGILLETSARFDSLAHELGHNLGLVHVGDSTDLMAPGGIRVVPASATDPAIATTIDKLTPDQAATARQPLFTIQGASATLGADAGYPTAPVCQPGLRACTLFVVSNAADSTQSLRSVDIRWQDPNALTGVLLDPLLHGFLGGNSITDDQGCDQEDFTTMPLGAGVQLTVTFHDGCLTPGRASQIAFTRQADTWSYQTPLSVQFNFDDGSTSLGALDASGDFLAATNTFGAIDTTAFADAVFNEAQSVPEPSTLALLLPALAATLSRTSDRKGHSGMPARRMPS